MSFPDSSHHRAIRRAHQFTGHLLYAASYSYATMSLDSNTVAASAGLNIAVSTHILNTATGQPAANVSVTFESLTPGSSDNWTSLGTASTNSDGRISSFSIKTDAAFADYRLRFATGAYLESEGHETPFFPQVTIQFQVSQKKDKERTKLHVPLLISPYGYSSYRGS